MGRLRQLPSRLNALAPRLSTSAPVTHDRQQSKADPRSAQRDALLPWRKWYKTGRWQKLRWSVLVRDLFACKRCGRIDGNTALLVADHITPHRGDEKLFWDEGNLQCLCKSCHDSAKQSEERAGRW